MRLLVLIFGALNSDHMDSTEPGPPRGASSEAIGSCGSEADAS